jgi:hypothetical protein
MPRFGSGHDVGLSLPVPLLEGLGVIWPVTTASPVGVGHQQQPLVPDQILACQTGRAHINDGWNWLSTTCICMQSDT